MSPNFPFGDTLVKLSPGLLDWFLQSERLPEDIIGRLRFHYDNENEYENDNEISMNDSSLPFRRLLQR